MQAKVVFITGTDTGVGKTVLTGLLLAWLREAGYPVRAVKPFCSGGREDAELLYSLQGGEVSLDEINPYFFREPLAPLLGTRLRGQRIRMADVVAYLNRTGESLIRSAVGTRKGAGSKRETVGPVMLVEGAGGLLAPLGEPKNRAGEPYNLLDVIMAMRDGGKSTHPREYSDIHSIVVAANRLGTVNHTLLTVDKLQAAGIKALSLVVMEVLPTSRATPDTVHNPGLLCELVEPVPVWQIPHIGSKGRSAAGVKDSAKRFGGTLRGIMGQWMEH